MTPRHAPRPDSPCRPRPASPQEVFDAVAALRRDVSAGRHATTPDDVPVLLECLEGLAAAQGWLFADKQALEAEIRRMRRDQAQAAQGPAADTFGAVRAWSDRPEAVLGKGPGR